MSESRIQGAQQALARRLAGIRGQDIFLPVPPGYVRQLEDNLIPGVDCSDFYEDLAAGQGGELLDSPRGPAKFRAAHSSAALAVNTFAPFRRTPSRLVLAGRDGFDSVRFEAVCPTGLAGTPPHLDLLASGPDGIVGVESKLLEPLSERTPRFSASYAAVMPEVEPAWRRMYQRLTRDPGSFRRLDAAQLVKHALGLRKVSGTARTLLYLYWEPQNASEFPEYLEHRDEAARFSADLAGSEIRFVAQAYSELWSAWAEGVPWPGMPAHLGALRERYELSI